MSSNTILKNFTVLLLLFCFVSCAFAVTTEDSHAVSFPSINVTFEPNDQSVIVDSLPKTSADGTITYRIDGYLNYGSERIETFCYNPSFYSYHIPEKQGYIFNWADAEFLLPCSGQYTFTVYVTAIVPNGGPEPTFEKGPKQSITFYLQKKDESTNWGPGLPVTTVEAYDLGQIQGKDKTIVKEEETYTWTIKGTDITTVPDGNISLKVTADPQTFQNEGVDTFFGETLSEKFNIEHEGEFGFKATLSYKLGAENSGRYANLFYVVGDGTFDFMESVLIDENGVANFSFTHASDYIVAITDEEYTGQELNPQPEEPIVEEPVEEPTSDETSSGSFPVIPIVAIAAVLLAGAAVAGALKKKN